MITLLLVPHIVLMISSLIGTTILVAAAAMGFSVSGRLLSINTAGTVVGIGFGVALLFTQPLDIRCLLLVSYIGAFSVGRLFIKRRLQQHALNATA